MSKEGDVFRCDECGAFNFTFEMVSQERDALKAEVATLTAALRLARPYVFGNTNHADPGAQSHTDLAMIDAALAESEKGEG